MLKMLFKYLFRCFVVFLNFDLIRTQIVFDGHHLINSNVSPSDYMNLLAIQSGSDKIIHMTSGLAEEVRKLRKSLTSVSVRPSYDCQNSMFEFCLILSQFVECLLVNSMPYSLCLSCSQQYSALVSGYADLNNSTFSNCSSDVLNGDKLNLVHEFYTNSVAKWSDGDCDSCFAGIDSNQDLVVNNDTKYYFFLAQNYSNCLNESQLNNSCISCKEAYNSIDDYYESLSANYSNSVCNDIIDSMKDIRHQWSQTLNCPIDSGNSSLHFLGLVFIVITLPFIVYVIGKLFCSANRPKRLLIQKRMSKYHLESYSENEPLINS